MSTNLCKTCSMSVIVKYRQEIYNMIFKNTWEYRTNIFCTMMQQNICRNIEECSHHLEKK